MHALRPGAGLRDVPGWRGPGLARLLGSIAVAAAVPVGVCAALVHRLAPWATPVVAEPLSPAVGNLHRIKEELLLDAEVAERLPHALIPASRIVSFPGGVPLSHAALQGV
eukprot:gene5694-biopygen14802